MKICHINLASGFGGGEQQTLQLIQQQLSMGYQLTVIANPKSPFFHKVSKLPCNLISLKHWINGHLLLPAKSCNIIHVHEGRSLYWAMIQNVLTGVPYILTRRIANPLKSRYFLHLGYKRAGRVIAISNSVANEINKAIPNASLSVIHDSPVHYPINKQNVKNIQQQFLNKKLIIQGGALLQHKGYNITIEAARIIEKSHPEIHIAFLGEGKERENLEAQAEGINNISFMGLQKNMGDWFAAASLQVHPSFLEGLGSVLLEGMAAGLPIIASETGGIPDVIEDGYNGRLIPPGDSKKLAQVIIELIENPSMCETFITNGQQKAKQFDIVTTSKLYEDIYSSLM